MTREEVSTLPLETRAARIKAARVFSKLGLETLQESAQGWLDIKRSIQLWIELGKVPKARDIYLKAKQLAKINDVALQCEVLINENAWYDEMRDV